MKKEYKLAKGWKIFIWLFMPVAMASFAWIGIIPFTNDEFNLTMALILTPFAIGFEALLVIGIIDTVKNKLIIDQERLIHIGVFKTKTLDFKNIKGCKVDQNYIYYLPLSKEHKKIKVSTYVGGFAELRQWSEQQFTNLDLVELKSQELEILSNEEFGLTPQDREQALTKAKNLSKVVNVISGIIAASTWFYPHFYQVQIILCGLMPIVGLIISKTSKGLIHIDAKAISAYPSIFVSLFFPSCVLFIRAILDFSIFNYTNLWLPALVVLFVFIIIVYLGSKHKINFKKVITYLTFLGMLLLGAMYAFGLLITTNAAFDQSKPIIYHAEILDKRISSGRNTFYYLKLSEWGPQTEVDEVSVARDIYGNYEIGDSADVYFSNGLFDIPYFLIIE